MCGNVQYANIHCSLMRRLKLFPSFCEFHQCDYNSNTRQTKLLPLYSVHLRLQMKKDDFPFSSSIIYSVIFCQSGGRDIRPGSPDAVFQDVFLYAVPHGVLRYVICFPFAVESAYDSVYHEPSVAFSFWMVMEQKPIAHA